MTSRRLMLALADPLTSVRSRSESLLAMPDMAPDLQEELLSIIAEESQRLSRMISRLLDLSRIEAGKMEHAVRRQGVGGCLSGQAGGRRGGGYRHRDSTRPG